MILRAFCNFAINDHACGEDPVNGNARGPETYEYVRAYANPDRQHQYAHDRDGRRRGCGDVDG